LRQESTRETEEEPARRAEPGAEETMEEADPSRNSGWIMPWAAGARARISKDRPVRRRFMVIGYVVLAGLSGGKFSALCVPFCSRFPQDTVHLSVSVAIQEQRPSPDRADGSM